MKKSILDKYTRENMSYAPCHDDEPRFIEDDGRADDVPVRLDDLYHKDEAAFRAAVYALYPMRAEVWAQLPHGVSCKVIYTDLGTAEEEEYADALHFAGGSIHLLFHVDVMRIQYKQPITVYELNGAAFAYPSGIMLERTTTLIPAEPLVIDWRSLYIASSRDDIDQYGQLQKSDKYGKLIK
jgi:hypothetical protein